MTDKKKQIEKMQAARLSPPTVEELIQTLKDNGIGSDMRKQAFAELENMPQSLRKTYVKVILGSASPKQRIKCFCIMCMGGAKYEVEGCTSLGCALYGTRPVFQKR